MSEPMLRAFIERFCIAVRLDCSHRFEDFPMDAFNSDLDEVSRGLLARQGSLLIELARNPGALNGHVAPLFHRAMAEVHITLSYILKEDQQNRARAFVLAGLSEEKLQIAHLERRVRESGESDQVSLLIEQRKQWLASQRFEHLTIVNAGGSTFGVSTRDMAMESDCADLYDFNFTPFSACVHSMWHHVARYNLARCDNPLHSGHRIPILPELESGVHELWVATNTFSDTLTLMDTFAKSVHPFATRDCLNSAKDEGPESKPAPVSG